MTGEANNHTTLQPAISKENNNVSDNEPGLLNGILDASLDGIFVGKAIRNAEGKIEDLLMLMINSAFTTIRKLDKISVIGRNYLTLFPGAKDIGMFDFYCQVIESGMHAKKEFHYKDEDMERWFEISAVKLLHDMLVVTFHDFTDFKKLQLQLESNMLKLEDSSRNLEYFAFASSHNLKEPLRKIVLFSDQLKRRYATSLTAEGMRYLSRIEAGVDRMGKLVDDLLVYSEISLSGGHTENVDLNNVIHDVFTDLELLFIERKIDIQIDHLPFINGNRWQLYQLFLNLIENCLKFSITNHSLEIRITSQEVAGKDADIPLQDIEHDNLFYQIIVRDNGIGFDERYVDRMFYVFQRFNSRFPGTGIGLSIAHKVMQNHNGWINASSEEGRGTKVILLFPCS